jgi:hypothetical protein
VGSLQPVIKRTTVDISQTLQALSAAPDPYLQQLVAAKGPLSSFALVEQDKRQKLRAGSSAMQAPPRASIANQIAQRSIPQMSAADPNEQGLGALPINMASGGIVSFDDGGGIPKALADQDAADKDRLKAVWDFIKEQNNSAGRAIADVATAVPRGIVGAYDSAVVRPMRAAGINAGFLSPYLTPDGAATESPTPFTDLKRSAAPKQTDTPVPVKVATAPSPAPAPQAGTVPAPQVVAAPTPAPAANAAPVSEVTQGRLDIMQQELRAAQARLVAATDAASKNRAVDDINSLNREITSLNGKNPSVGGAPSPRTGPTSQDPSGVASLPDNTTVAAAPNAGAGILATLYADKGPQLTDEDAAKKVLAAQDRFGIPALIEQRAAMAAKFQDAQDKAVAEKRAVTNKKNSGEEGLRSILNGMNDAIDKRTVYRSADLLSGGNKGYENFRKERDARETVQVSVEDSQRAMRFDMEQKLQEARILYAQGNQAAAQSLVKEVLAQQKELKQEQVRAATAGATNESNERAHKGSNDTSRDVAKINAASRFEVQDLRNDGKMGTATDQQDKLAVQAAKNAIPGLQKDAGDFTKSDSQRAEAAQQLALHRATLRRFSAPEEGTTQTPAAGPLDLSKWGAPAVAKP